MTEVTFHARTSKRSLFSVAAITLIALALASNVQVIDPFVRHDDFPALLATAEDYYSKTLHEGRWLNYLWHLRPFTFPAPLSYLIYLFLWSTFCAAAAINAVGRSAPLIYAVFLALFMAFAPQATHISLWFNTLLPGLALVSGYAVLNLWLPYRGTQWLLLAFIPLTLMAYSTFPLLLLAVCLTRSGGDRSLPDLARVIAIFVAGFAVGVLLIYGLNYWEHGVFGVPPAEWRSPSPATDLNSAISNLLEVGDWLRNTLREASFGMRWLSILMYCVFVFSFLFISIREGMLSTYIFAGLAIGISLLSLQIIVTGISIPGRSTAFIWILQSITTVKAALYIRTPVLRASSRVSILAVLTIFATVNVVFYRPFITWQEQTRDLASALESEKGPVYLTGNYLIVEGAIAAGIQSEAGLRSRLAYLSDRQVITCSETPERCVEMQADLEEVVDPTVIAVRSSGNTTVVQLSDVWGPVQMRGCGTNHTNTIVIEDRIIEDERF